MARLENQNEATKRTKRFHKFTNDRQSAALKRISTIPLLTFECTIGYLDTNA
jgi:hypothetical protein